MDSRSSTVRAPSKKDEPECPSSCAMISLVAGSLPAPVYSATSAPLIGTSRTKASCAALGASTPGQAMTSSSSAKSPALPEYLLDRAARARDRRVHARAVHDAGAHQLGARLACQPHVQSERVAERRSGLDAAAVQAQVDRVPAGDRQRQAQVRRTALLGHADHHAGHAAGGLIRKRVPAAVAQPGADRRARLAARQVAEQHPLALRAVARNGRPVRRPPMPHPCELTLLTVIGTPSA